MSEIENYLCVIQSDEHEMAFCKTTDCVLYEKETEFHCKVKHFLNISDELIEFKTQIKNGDIQKTVFNTRQQIKELREWIKNNSNANDEITNENVRQTEAFCNVQESICNELESNCNKLEKPMLTLDTIAFFIKHTLHDINWGWYDENENKA